MHRARTTGSTCKKRSDVIFVNDLIQVDLDGVEIFFIALKDQMEEADGAFTNEQPNEQLDAFDEDGWTEPRTITHPTPPRGASRPRAGRTRSSAWKASTSASTTSTSSTISGSTSAAG